MRRWNCRARPDLRIFRRMYRIGALTTVLVLGFLLFFHYARTPAPRPASAPAREFSADRAMADIRIMSAVPHPIGSPANARVRDYLVARMGALGLSPRVQRDRAWRSRPIGGETWLAGGDVENVIGVLRGADPAAPAVTLMAHYDSVAGSPGAADDLTGVADALEIARALKAAGTPRRDVMLVITDGEEAGLLGAKAFFADDPAARRVGFVLNMEARGGGGRAAMFETGPNEGDAARLFAASAKRPSATSLSVFVYKLLPNDTDYSVAKAAGKPGYNFAFIGRQFDYHSPSSTAAVLDRGSVQHMGEEALGAARALAFAPALPGPAPDAVYGDAVGDLMVVYSPWMGWLALVAAALLTLIAADAARRRDELAAWDVVQGLGTALLLVAAAALALHVTRHATGIGSGWYEGRALLARFPAFEAAMGLAALAAGLTCAAGLALGRMNGRIALAAVVLGLIGQAFGGLDATALIEAGATAVLAFAVLSRKAAVAGTWVGLLLSGLIGAAALQVMAPTTAYVVAWPTLAGAACAALFAPGGRAALVLRAAATIVMIATLAWTASLFHALLEALDLPEGPAPIVWLSAMALWPLLWPREARWTGVVGAAIPFAAAMTIALALHFTSPWSPRHPAAAEPIYVADRDSGTTWRASPFAPEAWSAEVLKADGGVIARRVFGGFARPIWAAKARPVSAPAAPIAVTRAADGTVVIHAGLVPQGVLHLDLTSDAVVSDAAVDGRGAPILNRPGAWSHIIWQAAPEGFTAAFHPLGHGVLRLRYALWTPGWPAEARPLPPLPAKVMAWDMAGATVVTGSLDQRF